MTDEIKLSLASAEQASQRARWIFFTLQVTSILVFMAFWHSRWTGWTLARLRTAEAAMASFDCNPDALSPNDLESCLSQVTKSMFAPKDVVDGRAFIKEWKYSKDQAEKYVEKLQGLVVDRVIRISVPFLGIDIDVNDLSLLGGITFLLLLMWFRFSLWREEENVRALFDRARKDKELCEVFDLFAMAQVLTVPPMKSGAHKGFWAKLPDLLFWGPVAVQFVVVFHDSLTFGFGNILHHISALVGMCVGSMILGLMIWTTLDCRSVASALDHHWERAYQECLGNTS